METLRVSRELLGRKVADLLRQEIIRGEIADGTRLVEDDLANRLGVSRGPVREAFAALERERLVRTTPGKGTYARGITEESVRQLFAVRALLEAYAAELAAKRIAEEPKEAEALKALAERFAQAAEQGRVADYSRLDHDIHRRIWQLSGNKHLADVLGYVSALSAVIISLDAAGSSEWGRISAGTHRKLAEAVGSGDPEIAAAQVRRQFASALGTAIEGVKRAQTSRSAAPPAQEVS